MSLDTRVNGVFNKMVRGILLIFVLGFLFQCGESASSGNGGNVTADADNDADNDGDGLIDISTAEMLNNMRYNLAGTSYKTSSDGDGDSSGCPTGACHGYELTANIDLVSLLDTNESGMIDTTTVEVAGEMHTVIDVSEDTSWVPVGDGDNAFTGIFDGNNNTIANLWVNISSSDNNVYAGLFGAANGTVAIRNVGVISGGVSSSATSVSSNPSSYSGGLVGYVFPLSSSSSSFTITNSYFFGSGGVSASADDDARSGGLVGETLLSLTIMNSYFSGSGGVSSSATSFSYSGGLVGRVSSDSSLMITNSYFSGSGGVSSSSAGTSPLFSASGSGGLVGSVSASSLTITNSYFSGSGGVSSSSAGTSTFSGGLLGRSSGSQSMLTFMNSYWNTDAPQSIDGGTTAQAPKRAQGNSTNDRGAVRLALAELQATSGTFPDLLGDAWDLGTDQQNPAVKRCTLNTAMTDCASPAMYGALLGGQR